MAITITIQYQGKGDRAVLFAQEMLDRGIVQAIRQEPGNLRYQYYLPLETKGELLLIDVWQDQAALDAHHASPMMEAIVKLRDKYELSMTVKRYVDDPAGLPPKDLTFIRK